MQRETRAVEHLATTAAQASLVSKSKSKWGKSRFTLHYCTGKQALRGVIVWAVMCVLHTEKLTQTYTQHR